MADGFIRVPPDSLGKYVRTFAKPIGSATNQIHYYNKDGLSVRTSKTSSSSGTEYIGEARPGIATASASWRIKRVVTAATTLSVMWGGGVDTFNQIWNNRYSLTYS